MGFTALGSEGKASGLKNKKGVDSLATAALTNAAGEYVGPQRATPDH